MGQEQFAGPEFHTDFDPEKFLRDLRIQAEEKTSTEDGEGTQDGAGEQP